LKNEWRYIEEPLKEKLKKNTATMLLFFITTFPLAFIITPMVLKYTGKELYGVWALVTTLLVFVELIGGLQMPSAMSIMAPKYDPRTRHKDINEIANTMFFYYLASAFVLALIYLLFGDVIFKMFFKVTPENLNDSAFVAAFSFYAFLVNFVMLGFVYLLNALNVMYFTNVVHIIIAYLRTAAMIGTLLLGYGIKGVVAAQMVSILAETVILLFCLKKVYPALELSASHISVKKFREMISLSLKLLSSKAAVLVGQNADKLILGYFINPVYAAYYQIGASVSKYISLLPEMMGLNSLMPAASELKARDMHNKIHVMFVRVTRYIFFAGILLCSGILVFGNEFITLWLGSGYEEAFLAMVVLAAAYTASLIGYPAMNILNGMERVKEVMWASIGAAVLNIVLSVILTKLYGLTGTLISAAISLTAGGFALYIIYRVISGKAGGIILAVVKPLLAAVVSLGVVASVEYFIGQETGWLLLSAKALLFTAVYAGVCIFVFKVLDEKDIELVKSVFKIKGNKTA